MKFGKYISLLLVTVFIVLQSYAQNNKYCRYDQYAMKAYQEKTFERAQELMASAIVLCPDVAKDPYAWHIKGFICRDLYKQNESNNVNSPSRERAIEAYKKSMELDKAGEFKVNNMKSIKSLAISYYNDAARRLDTNGFAVAIPLYAKYKETMKIAYPNYDFTSKDVIYNNVLGAVYKEKYENNKENNALYLDKSIESYSKTLALDSSNYSAYYNLGVIYYNIGVDFVLSLDESEATLLELIESQEKQAEYCQKALPYLKKAYAIKPTKEIIEGFRGIYESLNDEEKFQFYNEKLNNFDKDSNE